MLIQPRFAAVAGVLLLATTGCGSHASSSNAHSAPAQASAGSAPSGAAASPKALASTAKSARSHGNPGNLTDEQLVGQLFMAYVYGAGADAATPAQRAANISLYGVPTGAEIVRRWHLGGIILIDHNSLDPARPNLSTGNVGAPSQVRALTAGLQRAAKADGGVPLLIATDQEGGRVQRLTQGVDPRPAQQALARLDGVALRCSYFSLGRELSALGINQDFAPVADVVRTRTGVIGDRSFGPDAVLDGIDTAAAASGLQAAGVLATLKHWPGHGSTSTDSHAALAVIHESARQWHDIDRAAFAAAADSAGAIMIGHLALPAIDSSGSPATLSPLLINGQLRRGLHYQGLTVTDSLSMQPMQAAGTPGVVAIKALRAGDEMLLESPDVPQAETAVLTALRTDPGLRAVVEVAAAHLLHIKSQFTRPPRTRC